MDWVSPASSRLLEVEGYRFLLNGTNVRNDFDFEEGRCCGRRREDKEVGALMTTLPTHTKHHIILIFMTNSVEGTVQAWKVPRKCLELRWSSSKFTSIQIFYVPLWLSAQPLNSFLTLLLFSPSLFLRLWSSSLSSGLSLGALPSSSVDGSPVRLFGLVRSPSFGSWFLIKQVMILKALLRVMTAIGWV